MAKENEHQAIKQAKRSNGNKGFETMFRDAMTTKLRIPED